jgi:membrane-associated protease RseP (regulator of RpoE activity)
MARPTEVVVVLNKPTAGTKLGFIIESDYEGDDGHPRIGLIQPGTAANEVLVQGDIIVSINGTSVASHADAAKAIKAVKTGDVVIKVLAKKPRGTAPALAEKEVALEADAEREAATKMQATIRGNNARKEQAADPAPSVKNDVFQNIKTSVQGAATKVQELVNPTSPRSSAAETAVEQGSPVATDDERDAATKMQAMLRGNQSRKAMANGETPAAAPAEKDQRKSFGENMKGMMQRTGSAIVEPFALCTSPRKTPSIAVEGGLPKLANPA